jgi:hypothetical protein
MRARRTWVSDQVFVLEGGTEDNDLHATVYPPRSEVNESNVPIIGSTWVPTDEERARIANGENIELLVWGGGMPPVSMRIVDYPLGKRPDDR